MSRTDLDQQSVCVVLDWALYHQLTPIVQGNIRPIIFNNFTIIRRICRTTCRVPNSNEFEWKVSS
jgi:hypothetical protein